MAIRESFRGLTAFAISVLVGVLPGRADLGQAATVADDYATLKEWRFSSSAVGLPSAGLDWAAGGARWELASGEIRLQQPTSAGVVTGMVFRGQGRFRLEIDDPVELRQLRRFAEDEGLDAIDEAFTELVLRADDVSSWLDPPAVAAGYSPHGQARERHDHWLRMHGHDADSEALGAALVPGSRYLRADMKTETYGWLTFDFDSRRRETVHLDRYKPSESYVESWLSLPDPGASERSETGPVIDIEHVDIVAELIEPAREYSALSVNSVQPVMGRFTVRLDYRGLSDGAAALKVRLHPFAEITEVRDAEGRVLPVLRDRIGARSSAFDNDYWSPQLWVVLAKPVVADAESSLEFDYRLPVANYAPGRSWYPGVELAEKGISDLHTARFELSVPSNIDVRAMGTRVTEETVKKVTTAVWNVERPAKMVTFATARRTYEETLEFAGLPDVITFSTLGGTLTEQRLENVSIDVVNAINFMQELFAMPLEVDRLYATLISGTHGQSFDGFLHLGDASIVERPGATELFRAHEVAHQWWGHIVGWETYRDQWLSEAFAEYSAMMFLQAGVDNGDKFFDQILKAYRDELTGSIKTAFSKFARPGVSLLNKAALDRLGPISHGYRANVGEAPTAYSSQAYRKGAYVLHMLRMVLLQISKSDALFQGVLRDFLATHRGAGATTADFEATLAKHAPADWSWFFDQWVYGCEIPTYEWSYEVGSRPNADGKYPLTVRVRQSGVSEGFKMPVPVRAEFKGGRTGQLMVMVDEPEETFELTLPAKPKTVIFNADHAVLARTRKGK